MLKKFFWAFLILLLLLIFLGGAGCFYFKNRYYSTIKNDYGRTSLLLLGVDSSGQGDSDLTDSLIFFSLDKNRRLATMISLPRDLWIRSIQAKLNTAYHYGGADLAKQITSEVLGQPVDYLVVVDFDGFHRVVDFLGGITVEVKTAFVDNWYPIPGKENDWCAGDKEYQCRYETVEFAAGPQLMDGERALKYVRSRNAEGDEGTDFARAERQQQFLKGLREALLSPTVYLNPGKLKGLYRIARESVKTDVAENQYANFLLLAGRTNWAEIKTDSLNGDLLIHPRSHYSKQWVLEPKSGNWQEIHQYVFELIGQ